MALGESECISQTKSPDQNGKSGGQGLETLRDMRHTGSQSEGGPGVGEGRQCPDTGLAPIERENVLEGTTKPWVNRSKHPSPASFSPSCPGEKEKIHFPGLFTVSQPCGTVWASKT